MRSRPRLLVLTTTFPRWENDHEPAFVYELSKRLAEEFDITVVAPHYPGAKTRTQMGGMDVHRFRYAPERFETLAYAGGIGSNLTRNKWKYLLLQGFLLSFFFTALSLVRSKRIDVIHAHWLIPGGMIGAALKILFPKLRVIATAHGADVFNLKGSLFTRIRRWVAGEADTVSVVGNSLAERASEEGWHSGQVSIAPMGVDLQQTFVPRPQTHERPTLVFAGRLVEKKGVRHLIEAMPRIRQSIPGIKLLVAGHGPLQGQLEKQAHELALDDEVEFLGKYQSSELPAILHRADIAVLPFVEANDGDEEGFGLTTVEAMGCGLPVIAGDVAALRDIVVDGITGVLVRAHDVDGLASSIIEMLQDPNLRTRIALAGRAACLQRFDWDVASKRYADMLNRTEALSTDGDA